jgi:hypothetical protein
MATKKRAQKTTKRKVSSRANEESADKIKKTWGHIPIEPHRLVLEFDVKFTKDKKGNKAQLKAYLRVSCNGQLLPDGHNQPVVDTSIKLNSPAGNEEVVYMLLLTAALDKMREKLPMQLQDFFATNFATAFTDAINDYTYVPERSAAEWSKKALHDALESVLFGLAARNVNRIPTLKNAADDLTSRYVLVPPLTKDGLRVLLKRRGLNWMEMRRNSLETQSIVRQQKKERKNEQI